MITEHPLLRLTIKASTEIAADLFIEVDGNLPVAGKSALGLTYTKAKNGDLIKVHLIPN